MLRWIAPESSSDFQEMGGATKDSCSIQRHKQRCEHAGHEALHPPLAAEATTGPARQKAGSMRGKTTQIGGEGGSWAVQIKQNERNAAEEDAAAFVAGERAGKEEGAHGEKQ